MIATRIPEYDPGPRPTANTSTASRESEALREHAGQNSEHVLAAEVLLVPGFFREHFVTGKQGRAAVARRKFEGERDHEAPPRWMTMSRSSGSRPGVIRM